MHSVAGPWLWAGFSALIILLLAADLGLFHRGARAVGYREALLLTLVWVLLAACFNFWVFREFGHQRGLEFLTGYVVEYSLSVDNIFVFLLIFRYFSVPAECQHRALFWGIIGAVVMRAAFILLGTVLMQNFHWVFYIFGAFLVYSGVKMLRGAEIEVHPEQNPVVRFFRKIVPVSSGYCGSSFFVRNDGLILATPLLLVLVVIDVMDLIFAVDSIPAVFAVTRDPFIVFTSNIFAILGLRSLYFLLASAMTEFQFLTVGVGGVLSFVGIKMLVSDHYEISTGISLGVIATLLIGCLFLSVLFPKQDVEPGA